MGKTHRRAACMARSVSCSNTPLLSCRDHILSHNSIKVLIVSVNVAIVQSEHSPILMHYVPISSKSDISPAMIPLYHIYVRSYMISSSTQRERHGTNRFADYWIAISYPIQMRRHFATMIDDSTASSSSHLLQSARSSMMGKSMRSSH